MRAAVLERRGGDVVVKEVPTPEPGCGEVRLKVSACAVCRTDLHVLDGELAEPKLPLVLGHQIVGVVDAVGEGVDAAFVGRRVGVPWLGGACGSCGFCRAGRENLCDEAVFTGYTRDGGLAEWTTADARFVFPIPQGFPDERAAPLLCAGLIGYRAYRFAGDADRLGLFGFGAAAHLLCQVARHEGRRVFAFTRPGDEAAQSFARSLGAQWAGGSDEDPPEPLDAALLFAPVGALVPRALALVRKGGTVVCAGIHMSDIPSFPYALLWGERQVRSVANLTRDDGVRFFEAAAAAGVRAEVTVYPLAETARALQDLREGRFTGAAVVVP